MELEATTANFRASNDRLAAFLAGSREPADRVAVLLYQARRHLANVPAGTPESYAIAALAEAVETIASRR